MEETTTPPEQPRPPEPETTQATPAPVIEEGIDFKKFWFIPLLIVLVVIIVVGMIWAIDKGLLLPQLSPSPTATPSTAIDESTAALEEQGSSDEIEAIEADLENTDLSNIDQELTDIENELATP